MGGRGGCAPDFSFFFPPCSADHSSGISHRVKSSFFGLATTTLNVRSVQIFLWKTQGRWFCLGSLCSHLNVLMLTRSRCVQILTVVKSVHHFPLSSLIIVSRWLLPYEALYRRQASSHRLHRLKSENTHVYNRFVFIVY